MADVNLYVPIVLSEEGGYEANPNDRGNYTALDQLIGSNMGVTPAAYKQVFLVYPTVQQMKSLTKAEFTVILKKLFWDRWSADNIHNQSVANILVDWVYNSGSWGVKVPQELLGLAADGAVGPTTLGKLNSVDQQSFFNEVKIARIKFVENIVAKNASQEQFLQGWKNRINSFTFSE